MTTSPGQPGRRTAADWEPFAWASIVLAALCARLYDLSARVMSHDESIHAYSSFQLYTKGDYLHDPTYHGPLLYHVNALIYYFFGASDFTARLAPAITGTALVASLWMFRRYLGRPAMVWAGALMALSPTFLFYSRYIREDIYVALFTVIWVYGTFRYLEDRRPRWRYLLTLGMAFAFITKESSFISGAVIGSFFALYAIRRGASGTRESSEAAGDLAVLMFTLVLPFAAGPIYVALGWNPVDRNPGSDKLLRGAILVGALVIASAAAGYWRFSRRRSAAASPRDWAKLFALFWSIEIVFFTGFFTNLVGGLITGVAGSAGYWFTQHEVGRGGQPWFYYFVVGGLYEFLPLLVGGAASGLLARCALRRGCDPVRAEDRPDGHSPDPAEPRRLFALFTIWWAIGSWTAFAWAGERMPWLLAHQMLPVILIAGWGLARIVPSTAAVRSRSMVLLACGTAVAVGLVIAVLSANAFGSRDVAGVAAAAGWWTKAVVLALLLPSLAVVARRMSGTSAIRGVVLGVLLVLGLYTLRASLQLAYVNYDLPTELISYAQASPDVKHAMRTIEAISERTAGSREIEVAFDDETSWPFVWYLRDYRNARTWGTRAESAQSAPIILTGEKNLPALQPYVERGYVSRRYTVYWWPLQDYASITPSKLWASLKSPEFRAHLWRVFSRRDYGVSLAAWPLRREIRMFVRSDLIGADRSPALAGAWTRADLLPYSRELLEPELVIADACYQGARRLRSRLDSIHVCHSDLAAGAKIRRRPSELRP